MMYAERSKEVFRQEMQALEKVASRIGAEMDKVVELLFASTGKIVVTGIGKTGIIAHKIASFFPTDIRTYIEPFLGSGAVLAALQPPKAMGSDACGPLIEIWQCLHDDPRQLVGWYRSRYREYQEFGRTEGYERIKARYNSAPNGADLLFICRSCYGGVVRFRKADGYISTPCGIRFQG